MHAAPMMMPHSQEYQPDYGHHMQSHGSRSAALPCTGAPCLEQEIVDGRGLVGQRAPPGAAIGEAGAEQGGLELLQVAQDVGLHGLRG